MSPGPSARVSLRTIIAATDFSACSEAALQYAVSLAAQVDALLIVAHVVSPEFLSIEPPVLVEVHESAERQMSDLEGSEQLEGVRHKTFIGDGDTANVLANLARSHNADLIIAGTHGRTGIRKLVLGSVAKEILTQAPCPVLTVGPKVCAEMRRQAQFTRIIYATDFRPENQSVLPYVCSLVAEYHAAFTMMHVVCNGPGDHADAVSEAHRKLLESVPDSMAEVLHPETIVQAGPPAEAIIAAVVERKADLVVIGPHHPATLRVHLDTAYKLIVDAPCPVLTVRVAERSKTVAAS